MIECGESVDVLRQLIDEDSPDLSVRRQCELLGLSRSTWFYEAAAETEANLCLMRLPVFDGTDEGAVSGDAVLRQPPDDGVAASRRSRGESEAGPTVDAVDGPGGDLPEAAFVSGES